MTIENYLAVFDALLLVAQRIGQPSVTLHGNTAGRALRMWAARHATDVEVETQESVDSNERWSWTVMHVRRDDLWITVILEDDIRVPIADAAPPVELTITATAVDPFDEVPF